MPANTAHSPSPLIKHDDFEICAWVQQGVAAEGIEWIDYRGCTNDPSKSMSEAYIHNQFQAWRDYMGAAIAP